jgi:hypothetical protein
LTEKHSVVLVLYGALIDRKSLNFVEETLNIVRVMYSVLINR